MPSSPPILSLCIPTFNRSELLERTLANLVQDPAFDDRVEIVVSDNCSTDNTQQVATLFASRYSGIRYFRNEENIHEENFALAFSRATGRYVKLHNDYLSMLPGTLEYLLQAISGQRTETGSLFFYEVGPIARKRVTVFGSVDALIRSTYNALCWIANVGMWKDHFETVGDRKRFVNFNYPHVDWSLRSVPIGPPITVHFGNFYNLDQMPAGKAKYNVFRVNVHNLFHVYGDSRTRGLIGSWTLFKLKRHVFQHLVFGFYCAIILHSLRRTAVPPLLWNGWLRISVQTFHIWLLPLLAEAVVRKVVGKAEDFAVSERKTRKGTIS